MAVGYPRQPNPYGPPPFFGPENPYGAPPQPQQPLSFTDIAGGVGVGPGVGEFATPFPQLDPAQGPDDQTQLITPVGPANAAGPSAPGDDYPSQASIDRRLRLAKALMGQQQEVNHPLQAVGNAVNQIAGAYMENRAGREQERVEQGRREAWRKALSGGGDLRAAIDRMKESTDPVVQEKALELELQLLLASAKGRSVKPQQMIKGDQFVYVDEDGNEIEGYGGPRRIADEGGGDARSQQGGTYLIPGVGIVPGEFIPGQGAGYRDPQTGEWKRLPPNAQPTTPGTASPLLSTKEYNKLGRELSIEELGLKRLKDYFDTSGKLNQGGERMVDRVMLNVNTFFGSNEAMTDEQWALADADAQMNAIRGALRLDIAGPGNPSNYDMEMILAALGGRPISALQNKEVVRTIVSRLYSNKMVTRNELKKQYDEQSRLRQRPEWQSDLPETIDDGSRQRGSEQPGQARLPQGVPPKDKRPKGTRVTKGGKTFEWTGTGWREVK